MNEETKEEVREIVTQVIADMFSGRNNRQAALESAMIEALKQRDHYQREVMSAHGFLDATKLIKQRDVTHAGLSSRIAAAIAVLERRTKP